MKFFTMLSAKNIRKPQLTNINKGEVVGYILFSIS